MALQGTPTSVIAASVAVPGTVQIRPPSFSGTSQFYLQGGLLGLSAGGPLIAALLDGTAAAAGTVALILLPIAGSMVSVPFTMMTGAQKYAGVAISGAGGLNIKGAGGTAGTVVGYVYGVEVPRAS